MNIIIIFRIESIHRSHEILRSALRLRAAGQKAFAADTVSALRSRLDFEEPSKPLVELKPSELPRQRWEAPEKHGHIAIKTLLL